MGTVFKSSTFSMASNNEMQFCLCLYPNGFNEDSKGHVSLYIQLLSKPEKSSEVLIKLTVFILNSNTDMKKESKHKEGQCINLNQTRGFYKIMPLEVILNENNGYLPDDKLTILCEVSFICDSINISRIGQFEIPECKLIEDFGNLLDSHKLSDVTLVVGEHEFPAHKAILAARSDVFAAMFGHEMEEIKLNRVIITDIDHMAFEDMLTFIYTGNAPKIKETADRLLAAADKYALTKLKVMSEETLFDELSIETAAATLVLADLHNAGQLKEKTINFINIQAKEIIKTNGWQILTKNHSHLVIETYEALFMSPKENECTNSDIK